jgi:hypothetical protein
MNAKTPDELAELTPEERRAHFRKEEDIVFGADCKRDRNGKCIEQGIGSPGNINDNHLFELARQKAGRDLNEAILKSVKQA